jgi:hypothetical protein
MFARLKEFARMLYELPAALDDAAEALTYKLAAITALRRTGHRDIDALADDYLYLATAHARTLRRYKTLSDAVSDAYDIDIAKLNTSVDETIAEQAGR